MTIMTSTLQGAENNSVELSGPVVVTGMIKGHGNKVCIDAQKQECQIELRISGDNNTVVIKQPRGIKGMLVVVGSHVPASYCKLEVGPGFSSEHGLKLYLYNDRNQVVIGADCMFSNTVSVRAGESPHLVFDLKSGDYLDRSDGVFIGDHVWVGEGAYITKRVTVPDGCIVGAQSVVTHRFGQPNSVIAGNPAVVVRQDIAWVRNKGMLQPGSNLKAGYERYLEEAATGLQRTGAPVLTPVKKSRQGPRWMRNKRARVVMRRLLTAIRLG